MAPLSSCQVRKPAENLQSSQGTIMHEEVTFVACGHMECVRSMVDT